MSVSLKAINAGLLVTLVAACSGNPAPGSSRQDDAVSIGYGTQARGEVTGAIASVAADQIEETRATSVAELIRGRIAGVQVLRKANGDYSVRIRGAGTLVGNGEPLFVVDGVPVPEHGASTAIATLSPADVARIDVLKDAGASAIYGSRAANGVIVITTRRAN